MDKYITIDEDSRKAFDRRCNQLHQKGYSPLFDLNLLFEPGMAGMREVHFIQQWVKND